MSVPYFLNLFVRIRKLTVLTIKQNKTRQINQNRQSFKSSGIRLQGENSTPFKWKKEYKEQQNRIRGSLRIILPSKGKTLFFCYVSEHCSFLLFLGRYSITYPSVLGFLAFREALEDQCVPDSPSCQSSLFHLWKHVNARQLRLCRTTEVKNFIK